MTGTKEPQFLKKDENIILQGAKHAIKERDLDRARDLLTRLLKEEPKNAEYWIWLSAAVENEKERLYCLETAHKLEPENQAAKHGLRIMGALPLDDSVKPFTVAHPYKWKETLPQIKVEGKKRLKDNPLFRSFIWLGIGVVFFGMFLIGYGLFFPQGNNFYITPTHRPTFTLSPTLTLTPVYRTSTPTFLGPTPLSFFLPYTYTKTPLYALTEHPILTRSSFESGLRFLGSGDYKTARAQFERVLENEPDAADVYYFIGETYRLEENYSEARQNYQEALNRDLGFAPAFLGRALMTLALYPESDVTADFDSAISLDDQYIEAFIQRGAYLIGRGFPRAAIQDLEKAIELDPGSARAWMYRAQAELMEGEVEQALESALKANEQDMTLVPVYLVLAQAYLANGDHIQAAAMLQTYTIYEPDNVSAYLSLGTALNATGDYSTALTMLNKYLNENPHDAEAYFQRGLSHLYMGNPKLAEVDFRDAVRYNSFDFDAQLGLARAYYEQGKPGDAYVQAETNAYPLAKSNWTKAQVYYWEALFLEQINDPLSKQGARNSWLKLLALPAGIMPTDWRETAFEHLGITPTRTPTNTSTKTPTLTLSGP